MYSTKTTDLNKAKCQATPSQQPLPSNLYSVLIPQVSQENMFYFILLNPQLNFNIPSAFAQPCLQRKQCQENGLYLFCVLLCVCVCVF